MVNEKEKNNNSVVKLAFMAGIIEIVIAFVLILFELGIVKTINEFTSFKDDIFLVSLYISSLVIGFASMFIIVRVIFKQVYNGNVGKIALFMLIIQLFVFIIMAISSYQYVNQTIELLKEEESLKSTFYDDYAIKALLFRIDYSEWKIEYIKMLEEQKNAFYNYSLIAVACHQIGALIGIASACVVLKNKSRNAKTIETIQYGNIN